jgi:protein-S-isoprenylcysteine O-methyltransferase Ste14
MTTRTTLALDAGNITKIGVGVIVALVVIGVLLSLIITAIVGRIIILVVVVLLAVFVWQQRSSIQDKISEHKCNLTFFGMHLDPPDKLDKYCG